jgi:hypothetical protein
MNVRVDPRPSRRRPPDRSRDDARKVWGDVRKPSFYVIDGRGNGAGIAINRLLRTARPCRF